MTRKEYEINGWSLLKYKFLKIEGGSFGKEDNIDEKVTDSKVIRIYLDQGRCDNDDEKFYHKKYKSDDGFTVGEICALIVKTYWKSVTDIYEGDKDCISNLALTGFVYDNKTHSVYPETDS